jgi:hypothetical protein
MFMTRSQGRCRWSWRALSDSRAESLVHPPVHNQKYTTKIFTHRHRHRHTDTRISNQVLINRIFMRTRMRMRTNQRVHVYSTHTFPVSVFFKKPLYVEMSCPVAPFARRCMCGREDYHEFIIVNFSVAVGVHTCEDSIDLQAKQKEERRRRGKGGIDRER